MQTYAQTEGHCSVRLFDAAYGRRLWLTGLLTMISASLARLRP